MSKIKYDEVCFEQSILVKEESLWAIIQEK